MPSTIPQSRAASMSRCWSRTRRFLLTPLSVDSTARFSFHSSNHTSTTTSGTSTETTAASESYRSSIVGLQQYRDSLTQLLAHSLYQALLLYEYHERKKQGPQEPAPSQSAATVSRERSAGAYTTSVELECRLGELTPKNFHKLLQQELRSGGGAASTPSFTSTYAGRRTPRPFLSALPVTTPAVLHHKTQYQCRFDIGVSAPAMQRLEYLLSVPHRRPPHQIPPGERPLRQPRSPASSSASSGKGKENGEEESTEWEPIRTILLPPQLAVHGGNLTRFFFSIEREHSSRHGDHRVEAEVEDREAPRPSGGSSASATAFAGERWIAFEAVQKKELAYQSDVLCPNLNSDVRVSLAVERSRTSVSWSSPDTTNPASAMPPSEEKSDPPRFSDVTEGVSSTTGKETSADSTSSMLPWPTHIEAIMSHSQRSRSFLGKYLCVDMSVLQALPAHPSAFLMGPRRARGAPLTQEGGPAETIPSKSNSNSLEEDDDDEHVAAVRQQQSHRGVSEGEMHPSTNKTTNLVNSLLETLESLYYKSVQPSSVLASPSHKVDGAASKLTDAPPQRHREPLGALQNDLTVALLTSRQRLRKVELEVNIPALYADWKAAAVRSSNSRRDPRVFESQRPVKPIQASEYRLKIQEAIEAGMAGVVVGNPFYPSLLETDIHAPLDGGEAENAGSTALLYGVAQEMWSVLHFLAAGPME